MRTQNRVKTVKRDVFKFYDELFRDNIAPEIYIYPKWAVKEGFDIDIDTLEDWFDEWWALEVESRKPRKPARVADKPKNTRSNKKDRTKVATQKTGSNHVRQFYTFMFVLVLLAIGYIHHVWKTPSTVNTEITSKIIHGK